MSDALFTGPLVQSVGWALVHFIWQGALIAVSAAALLAFIRDARTRYGVACSALTLMLAVPIVTAVRLLPAHESVSSVGAAAEGMPVDPPPLATGEPARGGAPLAPSRPAIDRVLPAAVLGWLLGVVFLSIRLATGWYALDRLRRHPVCHVPDSLQSRVDTLAARLRVARPVQVVESALVAVPSLVGWIRPVILLPVGIVTALPASHLDAVIAHELAHVRRHDYLVNALQAMVETLLFYHPAVWWCSRHVRIEREHCCDDLAASVCGNPLEYATALASLEELRGGDARFVLAATDGPLLERVRRLLGVRPVHDGRPQAWVAAFAIAVVLFAGANSTLTGADDTPPATLQADLRSDGPVASHIRKVLIHLTARIARWRGYLFSPQFLPLAPPPPPLAPAPPDAPWPAAQPEAPAAPAPPAPPAPPIASAQGRSRMSWEERGERTTLEYRGSMTLADDDRDIVRMSPDAYFFLSEDRSRIPLIGTLLGAAREIELRGRDDGTIERRYFVGRREEPYEPAGRQWLSEFLPVLVRRTGFAADARVARILRRDGAAGVAREIGRLESDFVRSLYVRVLTRQATLSSVDLATVLQALQIGSDFEMAQALIAIAETQSIPASAAPSYFRAARTVDSDFELRRALSPVLRRPQDAAFARGMFAAAESIDSDFEQAEFLRDAAAGGAMQQAPEAFFDALGTIDSDFEHRRVLTEVLRRTPDAATVRRMFLDAGRIDADFEQAEFLRAAAGAGLAEQAADAFFGAVATIGSPFERRRTLSALAARPDVRADTLESAVRLVSDLDSEFEQAELLLAIARNQRIEGRLRQAILDVADSMHSDHERGRVLTAVLRAERAGR